METPWEKRWIRVYFISTAAAATGLLLLVIIIGPGENEWDQRELHFRAI